VEILQQLLQLFEQGMSSPLPVAPQASARYAAAVVAGKSRQQALHAARSAFSRRFGDHQDAAFQKIYGSSPQFEQLLQEPGEKLPTRFEDAAMQLWGALLAAEHEGRP
jgi:exodeoxyribonuclease V gamma subunit